MTTRLTMFTATLVQDTALSVSGLDRNCSADKPFAAVEGVPTLVGRGLKGAAVAMARRFFEPLPRVVSDVGRKALKRSAWAFADTTSVGIPQLRAGVGIRHKTGARAQGVLYDLEVIPAGTRWDLTCRVDWSYVDNLEEGHEAEGILGYVLHRHWAEGRCWLGGGNARGLGWCHLEDLRAHRLDEVTYARWIESGRTTLPPALLEIPTVTPTRSWCFRTLDVNVSFGEYQPDAGEPAWGVDMLAIGPHHTDIAVQTTGDGIWARPSWASATDPTPDAFSTDRAALMEHGRPLLPGASVRGSLRHTFSRAERAAGREIQEPHQRHGALPVSDSAGNAFGTVSRSSRILIRDARAEAGWSAAKLHMHAEDEFSAGSYMSAKRDAVRLLRGTFPIRIVIEGADANEVDPLVLLIDQQVALGAIGHLAVGGHKTRGAGWGRWQAKPWRVDDVSKERTWEPPVQRSEQKALRRVYFPPTREGTSVHVRITNGSLDLEELTLENTARLARSALGERTLTAWWCEPTINLAISEAPATFGREWPLEVLQVDEVAFYAERAVWRAARTSAGPYYVLIEEVGPSASNAKSATVTHTPARFHASRRFSSANTGTGNLLLREWHVGGTVLGFTMAKENC